MNFCGLHRYPHFDFGHTDSIQLARYSQLLFETESDTGRLFTVPERRSLITTGERGLSVNNTWLT